MLGEDLDPFGEVALGEALVENGDEGSPVAGDRPGIGEALVLEEVVSADRGQDRSSAIFFCTENTITLSQN